MPMFVVHFEVTQYRSYVVHAESLSRAESRGRYLLLTDPKAQVGSYSLQGVEELEPEEFQPQPQP
jgi:hypothetical protein